VHAAADGDMSAKSPLTLGYLFVLQAIPAFTATCNPEATIHNYHPPPVPL
jgi:hypothetical protein